MRKLARTALIATAPIFGALAPAYAQSTFPPNTPPTTTIVTHGSAITPLGWFVIGSIGCAAVSPMIGTMILGRELTISEATHTTLGCMLGPVGWLLADAMYPPTLTGLTGQPKTPQHKAGKTSRGRQFNIPQNGALTYVGNEVLLQFSPNASPDLRSALARALQLTQLETQTFTLTGRTIERWRIDGTRSVPDTLRLVTRNFPGVSAGHANMVYFGVQGSSAAQNSAPGTDQYIVRKLHLLEAHRINGGDDVRVAVIDSKIDARHPDLAGVVVDEFDATGTAGSPHSHGTAMAGAIAAHSKLLGVAPKVKLLAAHVFSGAGESAQSTTFNVLKGLDWAASKNARIVNMS